MNFFNTTKIRLSLLPAAACAASAVFAALALTGCLNDSEDHHEEEHHPWEHACVHADDEGTSVTAHADTAEAPAVGAAHTLYDVTFDSGASVKFALEEHGDFGLFLTTEVPFTLTTASGDTVEFEESVSPLEECPGFAVMHVAHLEEGAHYVTFGASAATTVGLLIEELEHEDEEHGDEH